MKLIFSLLFLIFSNAIFGQATISNEDIQKTKIKIQLAELRARDQAIRFELNQYAEKYGFSNIKKVSDYMKKVDLKNTEELKTILSKINWPSISEYGIVADNDAWLVVQHADHDPAFQEKCLAVLEKEFKHHQTRPENYAYLYDRVMVNKHKLQKYGTQGQCVGHYKWQPMPLENPNSLDIERKKMHLSSMADYIKDVSKLCP